MVKRFAIAALFAASIPTANAEPQTSLTPLAEQSASIHVFIGVGTTSACGLREAPHLIEHLLLSNTAYGENPVDAVLSLRARGIKLTATTHSDFTEFVLEGPASTAPEMEHALTTFLGRTSLPNIGFEREKKTIAREVRAGLDYISSPTFYERFIGVYAHGDKPCSADSKRFLDYTLEEVQRVYERFYVNDNIRVVAEAEPGTFDLSAIAHSISRPSSGLNLDAQNQKQEYAQSLLIEGREGLVEVLFPIQGRASLPADAAAALADQARLEVQAHIRREYQLYSARTFIDQSLSGGWIRLEVPELQSEKAAEIAHLAEAAMNSVQTDEYHHDPLWVSLGSKLSSQAVGAPIIAEPPHQDAGWLKRMWLGFLRMLGISVSR